MCRNCGAIVGAGEPQCAVCGAPNAQSTEQLQNYRPADRETIRFARAILSRPNIFTIVVLMANLFVFMLMWQSSGMTSQVLWQGFPEPVLAAYGAKLNYLINAPHYQWWRFITPMFVHVNLPHLLVNMYSLWIVGPYVEKLYGSAKFIVFWVLTGIAGVVGSYLSVQPQLAKGFGRFLFKTADIPSAGASGALFGLVGVLFIFGIKFRRELPEGFRRAFGTGMLPIIIINLFIGYIGRGFIDNAAHLGGLLSGAALATVVQYRRVGERRGLAAAWRVLHVVALSLVMIAFYKTGRNFNRSLQLAGVVKKEEDSRSYDRFRARLMFPVIDAQGRPIAFGGRALKPDDNAKYINSPETAAYIKGRNLFGLNLTRDEIRRQGFAILVEGFLDLIVPYQSGVRNVVASLGTALTAEQAKLLSRFARKVVVNYDGDRAGVQAARKSIEILLAEDIEVKVLVLPDNADPDEFIRKFGVTEYQRRRAQAQPHIQFVIENALRDRSLHRPADKAEAVEEVLPYIRAVSSRIQKREYFDMAMDSLGIDRDNVNTSQWRRELWQAVRDNRPTRSSAAHLVAKEKKVTAAEQRLLGLLLADADLRHQVLPMLKKEDYEDLATAPLFEALIALDREGTKIDFDALIRKTEGDDFAASVVPMVMMNSSLHGSNEHYVAEECVSTFRRMKIEHRIEELKLELVVAERQDDSEKLAKLVAERIELDAQRQIMLQPQRQ